MTSKRAQSSGPLQNIFIGVVVVALVGVAGFSFIADISSPQHYNVPLANSSAFQQFSTEYQQIENSTEELSASLQESEGGIVDIVDVIISGGFRALLNIITGIPAIINSFVLSMLNTVGLGAYAGYAYLLLLIVIVFAIVALVMKVRA